MQDNDSIVVRREWTDVIFEVLRFFIRHSSIEMNGEERRITVKYNGPKGYKLSFNARVED